MPFPRRSSHPQSSYSGGRVKANYQFVLRLCHVWHRRLFTALYSNWPVGLSLTLHLRRRPKALDCGYEPRVGLFASSSWVRLYKRPCHRLRNTTTVGHHAAAHCRRDSGRTYRPKARTPRSAQHSSRKRLPTLRRFDQRVWRRLKSAFGTNAKCRAGPEMSAVWGRPDISPTCPKRRE